MCATSRSIHASICIVLVFLHSINIHEIIESVNWLNFIKTNSTSGTHDIKRQKQFIFSEKCNAALLWSGLVWSVRFGSLSLCLYLYLSLLQSGKRVYILIFDLCYGIFCTKYSVLMWLKYGQRHAYAVRATIFSLALVRLVSHFSHFSPSIGVSSVSVVSVVYPIPSSLSTVLLLLFLFIFFFHFELNSMHFKLFACHNCK